MDLVQHSLQRSGSICESRISFESHLNSYHFSALICDMFDDAETEEENKKLLGYSLDCFSLLWIDAFSNSNGTLLNFMVK